ncbi:hypothetical protein [Chitinophaga filiformis]|uniref:Lipocalin-like domain-containing protein n=1 Tax=Chitinophaga filiformis TaxID=104663 RepID=A0ABY4I9L9_CHIFI|nr:hypothetical protein [Chitinophaga filiformis]UPK72798.1 hypothetical protein MYF79_16015 [Chitinophaga filiformis]
MRIVSKTLLLAASVALYLTSCKKTETPTEKLPLNAVGLVDSTSTDSLIARRTKLLTDSTWRYYEYFVNYSQDSAKLVFKRGKAANTINLNLNQTKFNTDGTCREITETGQQLNGTWALLNNGTQIRVTNSYGTFTSNIKELTANNFEWQSVDGATYGVEMSVFPTTDYSRTATAKITGRTWKYLAYFTNYPLASANLAYRSNRTYNPILNLSLNRINFYTDGTYKEVSETGAVSYGTWYLSNNDTRITVQQNGNYPAFTALITVLTSDRFEWNRLDNNYYYYGEQVAL